jgi:hypothetical protein
MAVGRWLDQRRLRLCCMEAAVLAGGPVAAHMRKPLHGVVQIRVTPKTRNPLTISALSISGVTRTWHFLNHADLSHQPETPQIVMPSKGQFDLGELRLKDRSTSGVWAEVLAAQ